MKFLADQDVYAKTVRLLVERGDDVITASQVGLSTATDRELLQTAANLERILVTRDRDFGNLVFVGGLASGVIYLRMQPATMQSVHQEFLHVLGLYGEEELSKAFVVIEPGRHRFRTLPQ